MDTGEERGQYRLSHDRRRDRGAKEDEADAGWNEWTTSKHGKVEWSRLIGMPERGKANGPLRARASFAANSPLPHNLYTGLA